MGHRRRSDAAEKRPGPARSADRHRQGHLGEKRGKMEHVTWVLVAFYTGQEHTN